MQHAVTLHGGWIFNSNEPWALPLSKKNLDCCTWSVVKGAVQDYSEFVSFAKGLHFIDHRKNIDDISLMSLGHTYV